MCLKVFVWMCSFFLFFLGSKAYTSHAVTFSELSIQWHKVYVIEYPTSSSNYDIQFVVTDKQTALKDILAKYNGIIGINGIFFCPSDYTWCNTQTGYTDNERYIEGEKYATYDSTSHRVVFWWTKEKIPFIFQTDMINEDKEHLIWNGFSNYPLILFEWKNFLEYYYDLGLIDEKMTRKWTRNFICYTKSKEKILFWFVFRATMDDMVPVLLELGCYDALNLDAWKSTAFILNNTYLLWPGRGILDAIILVHKKIDTKSINTKSQEIASLLIASIEKKTNDNTKRIHLIERMIAFLTKHIQSLYDAHKTEVYSTNNVSLWFQIRLDNTKMVKTILILENLKEYLQQYKQTYERIAKR